MRKSTVGAVGAGLVLAGSVLAAGAATAGTAPSMVPATIAVQGVQGIPAGVAAPHHPWCNWHKWHQIDRYTSWRYVDPRLAHELHVGPCAKVISGTDGSIVFTQDGYVREAS